MGEGGVNPQVNTILAVLHRAAQAAARREWAEVARLAKEVAAMAAREKQ